MPHPKYKTPTALQVFLAMMFIVILGCGGSGGTASTGSEGSILLIGNVGNHIELSSGQTVQLTVRVTLKGAEPPPSFIRFTVPPDHFEPVADVVPLPNLDESFYEATYSLTAKATTVQKTGSFTATGIVNGSVSSDFGTATVQYVINPSSAAQQVIVPFSVSSPNGNVSSTDKTYTISLTNPLSSGQFAKFRIGILSPFDVTIAYPDQGVTQTVTKPAFIGTSPHKEDVQIVELDQFDFNDTVVTHEILFGNSDVTIEGTWQGTFTRNTKQGTITIVFTNIDVAGVGGVTSSAKQTRATVTMTHPDGGLSFQSMPDVPEVGFTFRGEGTPFNLAVINVIDATPTSIRALFSIFTGEAGQESFNVTFSR